ncbi:hypothetical protein DFO73_109138 [Cytobacillus oceanisediminis]|jgi:hypothetical protein|uniref:Uncharacterized protein n=1 Tax=Cytobacillus oceanisediminis TaxID=665099 RepID=A0A2V2ZSC5_9BACI|nr:hypothetical protein DFO73_109138 [Cytobacillus oceanisediminis]
MFLSFIRILIVIQVSPSGDSIQLASYQNKRGKSKPKSAYYGAFFLKEETI